MLAGLFDEEAAEIEATTTGTGGQFIRPASPRNNTRLCGLSNLGATCYLNSLLQTLHYTPELREGLLKLGEDQLGVFSPGPSADNSRVRVIPIQLQKLFVNLLLLNQQSCEVDALTNSFGWDSSEEFQQHDVQELNRILFSAIESSLLGTTGEKLISQLYHGLSVQQIICQSCGRVSEREEEYLDLPLALSSGPDLQSVLKASYQEQELLEGANQYRCEQCQKLVDAKRGCKLRTLPQILTFALLRFLYDFERGERYKDTSKFKFPMELDMSPFCEAAAQEDCLYELFSVVIHSGSTHSGHYTAYIRDIDGLGTWTSPDEEVVQLPPDPTTGSVDLIDFDNPADLLSELLRQLGGSTTIPKLTKALQDKTGVTWNKRFKKQFGPINKFLLGCPDLFAMGDGGTVTLCARPKDHTSTATPTGSEQSPLIVRVNRNQAEKVAESRMEGVASEGSDGQFASGDASTTPTNNEKESGEKRKSLPKKNLPPAVGQCWFEFNDTHVSPVLAKRIESMFQGKQSAYMLFYRRKSLQRPGEAMGNPVYAVPERFQIDAAEANASLDQERQQYDIAINTVQLTINFSLEFVFNNGALQRLDDISDSCQLSIDRRKPVKDLVDAIIETFSGMYDPDHVILHIAKALPAGLHLYSCVSDNPAYSIAEAGITNNSTIFVWDGKTVAGDPVPVGASCEPIQIHVTYHNDDNECELVRGYAKNSTLGQLRGLLSQLLEIPTAQVSISQVKLAERSDGQPSIVVLTPAKDDCTLEALKLSNGDRLAVERQIKKGVMSLAHSVADKHSRMISLIIENRLLPLTDASGSYPLFPIEAEKESKVSSFKTIALATCNAQQFIGDCRLRGDDDVNGMGPPLYENQTLTEAGMESGQRVILESGPAPLSNQIALRCSRAGVGSSGTEWEVIVDRGTSVGECKLIMIATADLTGEEWHLRKTNWCGEAADLLEDEDASLDSERLKSGDLLLIEEGRLPPKGFVRLQVYLYSPDSNNQSVEPKQEALPDLIKEIPLHLVPPSECYPAVPGLLTEAGTIEISKENTLEELKMMILTLPAFESCSVPLPGFLRVRQLINSRPGKIFRQHTNTIKRLKITSGAKISCSVLSQGEELPSTSILFNLCLRIPGERQYGPPTEVIFDTAQSTTPVSLCTHVSKLLDLPLDRLRLAKHKLETFEWIRIQDTPQSESAPKRGRKKASSAKINIKNAPIYLKDGDTIGVKDLQFDVEDKDDFSTALDDRGKAILAAVQEDKRQRRKNRGSVDVMGGGGKGGRPRRQEVGIKIFVPDYTSKTPADK